MIVSRHIRRLSMHPGLLLDRTSSLRRPQWSVPYSVNAFSNHHTSHSPADTSARAHIPRPPHRDAPSHQNTAQPDTTSAGTRSDTQGLSAGAAVDELKEFLIRIQVSVEQLKLSFNQKFEGLDRKVEGLDRKVDALDVKVNGLEAILRIYISDETMKAQNRKEDSKILVGRPGTAPLPPFANTKEAILFSATGHQLDALNLHLGGIAGYSTADPVRVKRQTLLLFLGVYPA